jgi:cysteine desulfurase
MDEQSNTTRIYLDNNASTAVDERVVTVMRPFWRDVIGNAGSLHEEGQEAKRAIEESRERIAQAINAGNDQVLFTSGGTESNNMAILGTVYKRLHAGEVPERIHIITSRVEHSSVLDCFQFLERIGVSVSYIENDEEGSISAEQLKKTITPQTALVSLVYVNNEIGTIQNSENIKKAIRQAEKEHNTNILLHYDASQAPVWIPLDVESLRADFLTLDSQKIYGPKGIGALYIRDRTSITPILFGGGQEFGLRPGTPPTPLIVGFAYALSLVEAERDSYVTACRELRDWFIEQVETRIKHISLNGPRDEKRIAGNVSVSIDGVDGEQVVIELDTHGIAVSTGSACLSDKTGGSHIIKALAKENNNPAGTIRFSLSRHTTKAELEQVLIILTDTVSRLRNVH